MRSLFLSQISLGFSLLLLIHLFRNREISFTAFTPCPLWKIVVNLMSTSMHSVGSHTGMGSVILSTFVTDTLNLLYRLLALYNSAQHAVFSGETGWDITGKESVIRNVLHSDHKKTLTCTISNFSPCFKSFMINWENLIKIGRARGNKSNWKDWNLWM